MQPHLRVKSNRSDFDRFKTLDRRLADLERAVRHDADGRSTYCGVMAWYGYRGYPEGGWRGRVNALIGWFRKSGPAELQSWEAHDTTVRYLYDEALPPCRGRCGCNDD